MKQSLLIIISCLLIVVGCKEKKPVDHRRYFFISYRAMEGERSHDGNFYSVRDSMPSIKSIYDLIYGYLYCYDYYPKEKIVVMGITEFKDSVDYLKFMGNEHQGNMQICSDTLDSRPAFKFELADTTGYINFQPDTSHWSRKIVVKDDKTA